jgi:HK97 family phage prohead protease
MNREFRIIRGAMRAKQEKPGIEGYAAMFNEQYDNGWFIETIKPGAFTRALKEKQDVRALMNHDPNLVLGRTASGTLSMREDKTGLYFDCDLPDTQTGRDLHTLIQRGDIDGCSFGFRVMKQSWREEKDAKSGKVVQYREIEDLDLYDVGPVTFPAYPQTSVDARSLWPDGVPQEIAEHIAEFRGKTKKVGGQELGPGSFAYVGDESDTSTWKLPIHDANHVRNALARFNQTKGIPDSERSKVLARIKAAAKKFGIKVSEDNSAKWGYAAGELRDLNDDEGVSDNDECMCDCEQCMSGDCTQCSADPACGHGEDNVVEENAWKQSAEMRLRLAMA